MKNHSPEVDAYIATSAEQHAAFGFWTAKLMPDPHGLLSEAQQSAMHMTRITDVGRQAEKLEIHEVRIGRT